MLKEFQKFLGPESRGQAAQPPSIAGIAGFRLCQPTYVNGVGPVAFIFVGSENRNVEPTPSLLSTVTFPP